MEESTSTQQQTPEVSDFAEIGANLFVNNNWIFVTAAICYLPMVFLLQKLMKNQKAFDLRLLLGLWNFGLALFSILGAYFTLPPLFHWLQVKGITQTVCDSSCYKHPTAIWIILFNISKIPEMIDTIFIVLRKKPLIFLHWYHHWVTMLFCWYAMIYSWWFNCSGWWFASLNFTVHAFMYTYYGLTSCGFRPGWNFMLTLGQILQMAVGIFVVYKSMECPRFSWTYFLVSVAMYFSYFVLFMQFFLNKYFLKPARAKTVEVSSSAVLSKEEMKEKRR